MVVTRGGNYPNLPDMAEEPENVEVAVGQEAIPDPLNAAAGQEGAAQVPLHVDEPLNIAAEAANARGDAAPQVSNRPLPKDATKLPLFRGDAKDSAHVETFLRSLRRYFRANASSYRLDPNDVIKLSTCGSCFPTDSLARIWFDNVEDELDSFDEFETNLREEFEAGGENLVQLQQTWENSRQGRLTAREYYAVLTKLRMRLTALDASEKPSDRELLRKFCANLSEPARSVIAKKRITDPELRLPSLVKLAELEDHKSPAPSFRRFHFKDRKSYSDQQSSGASTSKYCFYCSKKGHNPAECRGIAARKAAGTWEEREPPKRN